MVDISDMSLDQLKELRDNCNVRIASLTLQEKKKENPRRYGYRTMDLYFCWGENKTKIMEQIRSRYKDFIKKDYDGWPCEMGNHGSYMIVRLFAPKEIRDEIREKYKYHRIYQEYTPVTKIMYKGYVIDGINRR